MMTKHLKSAAWVMLALVLASCQYNVPAADQPAGPLDKALLGVWESVPKADSQEEAFRVTVHRWNDQEYLIHYGAGRDDSFYYRAFFTEIAGLRLLQLECLGTLKGERVKERPYQLAQVEIKDDGLTVKLLEPEVVGRDHANGAALRKAIEAKKNDPKLFSAEPGLFKRVPVKNQ